jgi:hypothetical protein
MRDGELDRFDTFKIGLVHRVLAAGLAVCLLAKGFL